MSYATLAQFKSAIGITDSVDDTVLQSVLDATDALIDLYCDRKTGFGTATETRYYTAEEYEYVLTDDLVSITTLKTDDLDLARTQPSGPAAPTTTLRRATPRLTASHTRRLT